MSPQMTLEPPINIRRDLQQILQSIVAMPDGETPGTPENLLKILRAMPQIQGENVRYLIAGGWAVELLTEVQREHRDLDFLILDDSISLIGTDCLTGNNYAGKFISTTEQIKRDHVRKVHWNYGNMDVYVPSPEFLLASKVAKPMRQKDIADVNALKATFKISEYRV